MSARETIERINESIAEIISHYIELKQSGSRFTACCPFHGEKTPSFFVTPARGMYKCFGCGAGGDAINFIQEHEKIGFKEAVEEGAKKLNINFKWKDDQDKFNEAEYKHKESLAYVCKMAMEFFEQKFNETEKAKNYLKGRNLQINDEFPVGYAPLNNEFLKYAQHKQLNIQLCIEAGLIKDKDGRKYDFFRDRLMFPICTPSGKTIGFTGRSLSEDKKYAKYMNSSDTPIFTKGENVFGINLARKTIMGENRIYLVEGTTDVQRLHHIGVNNAVAPCGTALTTEQAKFLRRYSKNITLVYDGDEAGKKAAMRNGEILIKEKFNVNIILLPDEEDPDSFFTSRNIFEEYKKKEGNHVDFIIYKTYQNLDKCSNPAFKSEFIKDMAALVAYYDETSLHEVYMEELSKLIKPKKAWQDALRSFVAEKSPVERRTYIPKTVSLDEYNERGFYIQNNSYYFADKKGAPEQKSNFVLNPLFHIESAINAKRLYEVKNVHGVTRIIEISQRDLVAISAFRTHIESLGNFLWWGGESDLNRLKLWLYEKTDSCKEITQLGWQKNGFFAWGNGIFNGQFTPVDQYGIVRHNKKAFYIPAFSKIYEEEDNLYQFERKFIHMESNITLKEYFEKYVEVFKNNGKIALSFYIASLFRDIVRNRFSVFPILNLFGPKGAGKNACAESLLHLFGLLVKPPNVHNTSKPALADHVATSANALCVIDEYRNDIEMEKREFLKGLFDGTGRSRMNMDKDKKKETTPVDQGIVLCGQQMPTADIALFSRLIFVAFSQTEYSEAEKERFVELQEINKRGLTHITNKILSSRAVFCDHYNTKVEEVNAAMQERCKHEIIETRIYNNWLMIAAAYCTLNSITELPWGDDEIIELCVSLMVSQNAETKRNDDLGSFWKVVQMLIMSDIMLDGGDYKISYEDKIIRRYREDGQWKKTEIVFTKAKNLLFLNTSRVFSLYRTQALREGDKPMPESTVEHYLRHSSPFECDTKKENFKKINPRTNMQEQEGEVKKYTSTSALVFDLDALPISIQKSDSEEIKDEEPEKGEKLTKDEEDNLPF